MALTDLIYRCPACGHDPTEGEHNMVFCSACQVSYERGKGDMMLLVQRPGHPPQPVAISDVVREIEEWGGPHSRATMPNGCVFYSAEVLVSWRVAENPVHHNGQLRGFSELMGPATPGVLSVDDDEVSISGDGAVDQGWSYLELRSLQTSSSSLQLSLPGDRLVEFKFVDDSPRRWEELLRHLVREAYRRAGRSFVVEFQPRIVTR